LNILHKPFVSVEECVNNLPQFNNIYITNLKNDLAYIYDGSMFTTNISDLINNYAVQIKIPFDDNKVANVLRIICIILL